MSTDLNKTMLIGRLGKDVEIRQTANGIVVGNFTLATNVNWKDSVTGEKREATEWHRIVVWKGLAEVCALHIKKGSRVFVEGPTKTRTWEKDGHTHYVSEVHADTVKFL